MASGLEKLEGPDEAAAGKAVRLSSRVLPTRYKVHILLVWGSAPLTWGIQESAGSRGTRGRKEPAPPPQEGSGTPEAAQAPAWTGTVDSHGVAARSCYLQALPPQASKVKGTPVLGPTSSSKQENEVFRGIHGGLLHGCPPVPSPILTKGADPRAAFCPGNRSGQVREVSDRTGRNTRLVTLAFPRPTLEASP